MGQKVHPLGFRVGITKEYQSQWFARFNKNKYSQSVLEDRMLRKTILDLFTKLQKAAILHSDKKDLNSIRSADTSLAGVTKQNLETNKPRITQIYIERGLIPYEIGIQIHAENCEQLKTSLFFLKTTNLAATKAIVDKNNSKAKTGSSKDKPAKPTSTNKHKEQFFTNVQKVQYYLAKLKDNKSSNSSPITTTTTKDKSAELTSNTPTLNPIQGDEVSKADLSLVDKAVALTPVQPIKHRSTSLTIGSQLCSVQKRLQTRLNVRNRYRGLIMKGFSPISLANKATKQSKGYKTSSLKATLLKQTSFFKDLAFAGVVKQSLDRATKDKPAKLTSRPQKWSVITSKDKPAELTSRPQKWSVITSKDKPAELTSRPQKWSVITSKDKPAELTSRPQKWSVITSRPQKWSVITSRPQKWSVITSKDKPAELTSRPLKWSVTKVIKDKPAKLTSLSSASLNKGRGRFKQNVLYGLSLKHKLFGNTIKQSLIQQQFVTLFVSKTTQTFINYLKQLFLDWQYPLKGDKALFANESIDRWSLARLDTLKTQPVIKLKRLFAKCEVQAVQKMESLRKEFFAFGYVSRTGGYYYFQLLYFLKNLKQLINILELNKTNLAFAGIVTLKEVNIAGLSLAQHNHTYTNNTYSYTPLGSTKDKPAKLTSLTQTNKGITTKDKSAKLTTKDKPAKLTSSQPATPSLEDSRKVKMIEYLKDKVQKHRTKHLFYYLPMLAEARKDLKKLQKYTKQHSKLLLSNLSLQTTYFKDSNHKSLLSLPNNQALNTALADKQTILLEQIKKQTSVCKDNLTLTPNISIKFFSVNSVDYQTKASTVADSITDALEKRKAFRKVIKDAKENLMKSTAVKGVKIQVSGRLNGAEIARSEWVRAGRVPLQTLRANIDYSYRTAHTIYGIIGVKVWIFKGYSPLIN
uniref:ribosomal protein S3 n=1 Tax=Leontynka pallida TaxID=2912034 RepID=UPI00202860F7|nr:ribosomal protein S3 [Leontynka pallida]UPQ43846.1 ribosomal protein S3 [Leontynka pallida]